MNADQQQIGRVIAKAWADEAFKGQLLSNPAAALAAEGVAVPAGMTVKVVENTDTAVTIVLPPKPAGELSDAALENVGGAGLCWFCGGL